MSYPDEVDGTWSTKRMPNKPACECTCHTLMGMKHVLPCCTRPPIADDICADKTLSHYCYRPKGHENAHEASDSDGYLYTWWDETDILDTVTSGQDD